jgi:hypothetical protein
MTNVNSDETPGGEENGTPETGTPEAIISMDPDLVHDLKAELEPKKLSLKTLDAKIDALDDTVGGLIGPVMARVSRLEEQVRALDGTDGPEDGETPQWVIDIVQGVVEALHGVRLQGARTQALQLEQKYLGKDNSEILAEEGRS